MPEILEVEEARQLIEARALDRAVATVEAPDAWYLKRGLTGELIRRILPGHRFTTARRRGKLLLLDTEHPTAEEPGDTSGPTVGLHLGMTGRVLVDGIAAGEPLLYASDRENPVWHRFTIRFADGGSLALRDPRRLGAVELEPVEDRLGPDAFTLNAARLRAAVGTRRTPIKAALMNQAVIAGLGNLLVDEILWRAGIAPGRIAASLDRAEEARLARSISTTLRVLGRRGGSHTGDLMAARQPGGFCPRDGAPLRRETVAGRTTYWCPVHQR
ncbi:MAG TPA: DNA-formamidopyrimidine glycosylase family protein [Acidimicrobiia bacterium]|nr:DNA-formamidopyrimidine glycosylase family protein [Acidimicrobiia bacterium]